MGGGSALAAAPATGENASHRGWLMGKAGREPAPNVSLQTDITRAMHSKRNYKQLTEVNMAQARENTAENRQVTGIKGEKMVAQGKIELPTP